MARRSWPIAVNPVSGAVTYDAELSTTLLPVSVNHQTNAVAWTGGATTDKWPVSVTLAGELSYSGSTIAAPPAITWAAAYWASDPLWTAPADGAAVASWRDFSGNALDAAQGTSGKRPVYVAANANLNGQASISFVKANSNSLVTPSFAVSQPLSVVLIASDMPGSVAGDRLVSGITAVSVQVWAASTGFSFFAGSVITQTVTMGVGTGRLVTAVFNGTNSKTSVESTLNTGVSLGTNTIAGGVTLGARGDDLLFGDAKIAFVGIYSGDVTGDGNWSAFRSWASSSYGVAVP